jgi:hypothetical protein
VQNRAEPFHFPVSGEVQLGGIVQDEDQIALGHVLVGEAAVGLLDGVMGDGIRSAELVEAPELVPVEGLGEGAFGCRGNAGGRIDESAGAAWIAQVGWAEVVLGPLDAIRNGYTHRCSSVTLGGTISYHNTHAQELLGNRQA